MYVCFFKTVPNTEGNDNDEFCCSAPTVLSISSGAALPNAESNNNNNNNNYDRDDNIDAESNIHPVK